VGFLVDLDDLHLDGLADGQDLLGVVDAAPGHVGDVQQAVDTAQIDEGAVFGDVLDHAVHDVAFGELADDLGALLGAGFFEDRAARHNDVAPAAVHLEDLERLLEAHQRARVAHGAHIDLGAGQEGHGTAEIDGEATLHAAEDGAFDALFVRHRPFPDGPRRLRGGHLVADHGLAARVLDAAQIDLDLVADFDLGRFARACEFLEVDPAFHLVADIDDGLSRLDGDDLALDDRPLVGRVDFEAFVQEGFEFLHGCFSAHAVSVSFFVALTGRAVVSAGLGLVG
jgi:hypothetical protein